MCSLDLFYFLYCIFYILENDVYIQRIIWGENNGCVFNCLQFVRDILNDKDLVVKFDLVVDEVDDFLIREGLRFLMIVMYFFVFNF